MIYYSGLNKIILPEVKIIYNILNNSIINHSGIIQFNSYTVNKIYKNITTIKTFNSYSCALKYIRENIITDHNENNIIMGMSKNDSLPFFLYHFI